MKLDSLQFMGNCFVFDFTFGICVKSSFLLDALENKPNDMLR